MKFKVVNGGNEEVLNLGKSNLLFEYPNDDVLYYLKETLKQKLEGKAIVRALYQGPSSSLTVATSLDLESGKHYMQYSDCSQFLALLEELNEIVEEPNLESSELPIYMIVNGISYMYRDLLEEGGNDYLRVARGIVENILTEGFKRNIFLIALESDKSLPLMEPTPTKMDRIIRYNSTNYDDAKDLWVIEIAKGKSFTIETPISLKPKQEKAV